MKRFVLIIASVYGSLSVVLGAMGAHALKSVLSVDKLQSFETGVRYMIIHALVLLIVGFVFDYQTRLQKSMGWSFIVGTFLFSISIFFLSLADTLGMSLGFLGPITPLGGLLMITGWILLLFNVLKMDNTELKT
ncbi:DUF423 domain-containing protein [Carboxylicivirga linearis]|uniref:DUF423 domain-containing protein n=1 Tax=Carboxylicivirga linearis TaxID=1628157 RepID=A0ABS5JX32_9BACT|nr:DUF423 domain-containing protein [Carboxylicivirga linearis]MBS2099442.1 DUF423 domain-containing protein [Carboxylicivirga linearis]